MAVVDKVSLGDSDVFSCSRPALSRVATTCHKWLLNMKCGKSELKCAVSRHI